MNSYRELIVALRQLGIDSYVPLLVHADKDWMAQIRGSVGTVLTALLSSFDSIMVTSFTSSTMVIPLEGPPENALDYGEIAGEEQGSEIFNLAMPADLENGRLANELLLQKNVKRSNHPLLSFMGIGVDAALQAQTLQEPYEPIRVLGELQGWVLLLGGDHAQNFSLHYAEKIADRKQFVRWALTEQGIVECMQMPGCSRSFNEVSVLFKSIARQSQVGERIIQAFPIAPMIQITMDLIHSLPEALLCKDHSCRFCRAVRKASHM